jgi:hypothetical protein
MRGPVNNSLSAFIIDKLLPARLDGVEPQAPEVWSGGKHLTENEWDAHLTIMRHQYPVVVFSKASITLLISYATLTRF